MRPASYLAILINAAVLLWLCHASAVTYVRHFTDPEWLSYGVASHFQWIYAGRWVALASGLISLFVRHRAAIAALIASHVLVLASGSIGAVIASLMVVGWSGTPSVFVRDGVFALLLSVSAVLPLAIPGVSRDLGGIIPRTGFESSSAA